MKHIFFIGTTAELIKVMPVMKCFSENKTDFEVITSGQNLLTGNPLWQFGNIPIPNVTLSPGPANQTSLSLLWWFFKTLVRGHKILSARYTGSAHSTGSARNETYLIVHGDTISTVMGAILGKLLKMRVAHIEAGIRSFSWFSPFPEEIDRMLVSKLADVHLCPNKWAVNNLKNVKGIKVNTQQNTLLDSLYIAQNSQLEDRYNLPILNNKFFVFVLHRQENVFNKKLVTYLINQLLEVTKELPCLFVMHPLTKKILSDLKLYETLTKNPNITITKRLPYFSFMHILEKCEFLITDGGSNQEEAYYLGKPCLVLRKVTERTEGLGENVILSKGKLDVLPSFVKDYTQYQRLPKQPTVSPSSIIWEVLK